MRRDQREARPVFSWTVSVAAGRVRVAVAGLRTASCRVAGLRVAGLRVAGFLAPALGAVPLGAVRFGALLVGAVPFGAVSFGAVPGRLEAAARRRAASCAVRVRRVPWRSARASRSAWISRAVGTGRAGVRGAGTAASPGGLVVTWPAPAADAARSTRTTYRRAGEGRREPSRGSHPMGGGWMLPVRPVRGT